MQELKPCPLCGSTSITCFAEYNGDSYDNEPVYRAVVACLGCHEDGCDPDYDEEPCFGIEAYFRADHPLIRDLEDPEDCERVLEHHMAERWNRRAERTEGGIDVMLVDFALAVSIAKLEEEEDPEKAHVEADKILVGIAEMRGYTETAKAFEKMVKWYA